MEGSTGFRIRKNLREHQEANLIQEGRNQVLYLLLCITDENVTHDNWHPDKADYLTDIRKEILGRLEFQQFPKDYPDFKTYLPHSG